MNGVFVTGTDTEVGKTVVSCALIQWMQARTSVAAFKPVAAGAEPTNDGWVNEDADRMLAALSDPLPLDRINPVCLKTPMAPHLAAEKEGVTIDQEKILDTHRALCADREFVVVEGAGGWHVPLIDGWAFPDLAQDLAHPVLVVVGMRLGCLNHARLTVDAIQHRGLPVLGWVANRIDPEMTCLEENIATLKRTLPVPMLADFPHFGASPSATDSEHWFEQPLLDRLTQHGWTP